MNLTPMRARVERLRQLAHGMGKEVAIWKAQEGLPRWARVAVVAGLGNGQLMYHLPRTSTVPNEGESLAPCSGLRAPATIP